MHENIQLSAGTPEGVARAREQVASSAREQTLSLTAATPETYLEDHGT